MRIQGLRSLTVTARCVIVAVTRRAQFLASVAVCDFLERFQVVCSTARDRPKKIKQRLPRVVGWIVRKSGTVVVSHRIHIRPHSEVLYRRRKCQPQVGDERFLSALHFHQETQRQSDLDEFVEAGEVDDSMLAQAVLHVAAVTKVQHQLPQVLQPG